MPSSQALKVLSASALPDPASSTLTARLRDLEGLTGVLRN